MPSDPILLQETPPGWHSRLGTLKRPLYAQGRGLHTGRVTHVRIVPASGAEVPDGIVFKRMRGHQVVARASVFPDRWRDHPLCSSVDLGNGLFARTVEHLLAALLMCEIDAATVEIDNEEIPILDASAQEWIRLVDACGRRSLPQPKRFLKVLKEFTIKFPKARYQIKPAPEYRMRGVTHEHDFSRMEWRSAVTPAVFREEVAAARSFGHLRRVFPALVANLFLKQPIIRGILHAPVALICMGRVRGGMRLPDEFVRHRVLDCIGDFAFLGAPILGDILAHKPSHTWNHAFLRQFLEQEDAWCWAQAPDGRD